MHVIRARNVHGAIPLALEHLTTHGWERDSRNGRVVQAVEPVATVYERPWERVIFWPERDANPFFHLYESVYMLAGRRDVAGVKKFVKTIGDFSDDGETFHASYGHRWRYHFGVDQIETVVQQLLAYPEDRRCVLQMWDATVDLGRQGKDLPCNLTVTFQVSPRTGDLCMVVFCRSNDVVWGAYGANAVHFSTLQEYVARRIGRGIGTYTQVSVNFHMYDKTRLRLHYDEPRYHELAYPDFIPMPADVNYEMIRELLRCADADDHVNTYEGEGEARPWEFQFWRMTSAHKCYRAGNLEVAISYLDGYTDDWSVAGLEWLQRRKQSRLERTTA